MALLVGICLYIFTDIYVFTILNDDGLIKKLYSSKDQSFNQLYSSKDQSIIHLINQKFIHLINCMCKLGNKKNKKMNQLR